MRPPEGPPFLPGWRTAQDGLTRIRQKFAAAPLVVKIITVVAIVVIATAAGLHVSRILQIATGLLLVAGLAYGPFAVASGRRSVAASLSVAVLGVALAAAWFGARGQQSVMLTLLLLPLVVSVAAHAGSLGRWVGPCRTPGHRGGAVPAARVGPPLGGAGGRYRGPAGPRPARHRPGPRLGNGLHRAGLAAGQVTAGRPGGRPARGAPR